MKKKIIICVLLTLCICIVGCGNKKVTDQQMTLALQNGENTSVEKTGLYTGEIDSNGKPTGKGIFKTENKSENKKWKYEGDFKDGNMNGKGVRTFDNGCRQEGVFKNGVLSGFAKETINNRPSHEGEYKYDLREGQGKLFNKDTGKLVYEGTFSKGMVNGKGKVYKDDGTIMYEGLFINGQATLGEIGIHEKAIASGWEYSVSDIKSLKNIGNKQADGVYLILLVNAKNNGTVSNKLGENFFELLDDQGRLFEEARVTVLWEYEELLKNNYNTNTWYTPVNPGITAKNIPVIFEVPEDCKKLWLLPSKDSHKSKFIKIRD